jgi:hypothetical protein
METSQKIIIALLVLAILFSIVSIYISATADNLDISNKVSGQVSGVDRGKSGIGFYVEGPPSPSGGVDEG